MRIINLRLALLLPFPSGAPGQRRSRGFPIVACNKCQYSTDVSLLSSWSRRVFSCGARKRRRGRLHAIMLLQRSWCASAARRPPVDPPGQALSACELLTVLSRPTISIAKHMLRISSLPVDAKKVLQYPDHTVPPNGRHHLFSGENGDAAL